jgi:tRNA (guanine10-N2)-methyltransferase
VGSPDNARKLASRSMSVMSIYELWGQGTDYEALHIDIKKKSQHLWSKYENNTTFRFSVHGFQGKRDNKTQREIIDGFKYTGFKGPVRMKGADQEFCVFEDYAWEAKTPHRLFLGRFLGYGGRDDILIYDLKKRAYISTTSMDSELALITANMAHAAPGKLFFDPFMGTGGFCISCAHFGAMTFGGDIDGRSVRGTLGPDPMSNFVQYGLTSLWMDSFITDITNTPLRNSQWLDGIVCDPPYGVREGLKVLGSKTEIPPVVDDEGIPTHLKPGYIASKKPYSFERMLEDILQFAAEMLVDGGRMSMWMPVANDEDIALAIPQNMYLQLRSSSIQPFNKWSRRLLTYQRLPTSVTGPVVRLKKEDIPVGAASELNNFRRRVSTTSKFLIQNHLIIR